MAQPTPARNNVRRLRGGLVACAAVTVAFGAIVELRSAFLTRRMGDLGVFLRAAWAVRSGEDIYAVTDTNGFHYHYPPLLAVLLMPLADPPPGVHADWVVPFAVSVAIVYALNVACLALAVHVLASAVEATSAAGPAPGDPRWWTLRLVPVLACLPPIGHTLMRGQVGTPLLLLLCATAAALLRDRRFRAGVWLSGAICLKVIPAYLLVLPVWRRDGRWLAGCALGLVVGLVALPSVVIGPARTWSYAREWAGVLAAPGLGVGDDASRARELIDVTATDSQSFQAMIHNTRYPDPATRPRQASAPTRAAHWLIGGVLTALTLWAGRRRPGGAAADLLTFGSLVVVMILLSPVCHLHYFCLCIPLVMGLIGWRRQQGRAGLGLGLWLLLAANLAANVVPQFSAFQPLRDGGLASYGALLLWLTATLALWRAGRAQSAGGRRPQTAVNAAA